MTLLEALTVTVLGMGVVFLGLVLCILFINVFNRVAKRVKWGEEGGHGHAAAPKPAEQADAVDMSAPSSPSAKPAAFVPPTPEVIAVIAATLEMEHRLYGSHVSQRLTIRRAH
jgi:Na+-transporting methylmalonyl-CoA/oxaloacetate decarboxylase gamma subunit